MKSSSKQNKNNTSGSNRNNGRSTARAGNARSSGAAVNYGVNNQRNIKDNASANGHNKQQNGKLEASLLGKFFLDQLKDIYYAENKIAKALPEMQEAASAEELKEAFDDHMHQTQKHIKRLEKAFQAINEKPEGKKCEAIEGIIKECDTIISETQEGSKTRDAALIIGAQKVEHYEIATYGGLVQLALTMELDEVAELLDRTLMEEEDTDAQLTDIAETHINFEAEQEGGADAWQQQNTHEEEEDVEEMAH